MKTGVIVGIVFLVLFLVGFYLFRKYWNKPKQSSDTGGGGTGKQDSGKNDNDNQTT